MKYIIALFVCALFLPCVTFAAVKINEVAWMGTTTSQYNEWIELYNDGTSDVSLAGWKLYKTGDQPLFTLTKTIAAGAYLLVERTTASAPDAVPGVNDEAGTFSNGGLSNSGEDVVLKDNTGTVADSISFASGWPAGDSTTKDTMQWNGSNWITASGTPDTANATADISTDTPPSDDKGATSSSESSSDSVSSSSNSSVHTTQSTTSTSASSVSKKKVTSTTATPAVAEPELALTVPQSLFQGAPITIQATTKNLVSSPGYFYWNMGDGTTYTQSVLAPVQYTYHYAGSYTVSLYYYNSQSASQSLLQVSVPLKVVAPLLDLKTIDSGAALQISNKTAQSIDIGQWPISTSEGIRALPPMTMIAAHASITITKELLGLHTIGEVTISTPDGAVVGK